VKDQRFTKERENLQNAGRFFSRARLGNSDGHRTM
jgi:hypothetical protein